MEIKIRPITPGDNAGIERIIKSVLEEFGFNRPGTAYFDASLKDMFGSYNVDHGAYFVAEIDNLLCGGAGIYPTNGLPADTCELSKMYLLPIARGNGIGGKLLNLCLETAKGKGYQNMYLETMPELTTAVSIYQRNGFQLLDKPLGDTGHYSCPVWMLKPL